MVAPRTISAFEAKQHLGGLLDRVQGGEELLITRHGQPVARLVPVATDDADRFREALDSLDRVRAELAKSGRRVSRAEIHKWRNEGRR